MTTPEIPIAAYLDTIFGFEEADRHFQTRIGLQSTEIDQVLQRNGVHTGVFITGWNPYSRQAGTEANHAANLRMAARFDAIGVSLLPLLGHSSDGSWSEEGFFALGVSRDTGLKIAAEFEQHAIVFCELGKAAELALTSELQRTTAETI